MKTVVYLFVLLLASLGKIDNDLGYGSTLSSEFTVLDEAPEFYVLDWKEGTQLTPQQTDLFIEIDSMGRQEVFALLDKDGKPVLYASDVSTPVCADGECKLMNIKLYWTLLGKYAGFDRYPGLPLTKHDHDEFKFGDYQKLHALLTDDKSILGRRRVDELVEKPKMRSVNGVDAISGATVARVKESVVGGALYSCYVAWYLVHGEIRDKLKNHTLSVLNHRMVFDMLYSNNADYHLFALGELDQTQYAGHYLQVAEIFKTSTPLIRSMIAKTFVNSFQDTPELQKPFWEAFSDVDLGTRSLMLRQLDIAPEISLEKLSAELHLMTKNQLKAYLGHLSEKKNLDSKVLVNLKKFAESDKNTFAYLAKNYFEDFEIKKTN